MRVGVAAAVAIAIAAPAVAHAQSTRYPKPPVDTDREREQHSDLWDATLHPQKGPYKEALDKADAKLRENQDDERVAAIKILDGAIELQPAEPAAYRMRGGAFLALHEWARCADDLGAAAQHAQRPEDVTTELRRDLGVCQARAGRLADAEHTLADAAANGTRSVELWMRLGETRIAMGKLDEARSALDTALDMTDGGQQTPILWLRALANDRARLPGEAEDDVRRALGFDRTRSLLEVPVLTPLGDGEKEYALGLSYADADPREPELAIVYFRRFVQVAPKSPWRKRADEHLRDLQGVTLPIAVKRIGGAAALDLDATTKIVQGQMPKLRACLAHMPGLLLEVKITRAGPRAVDTAPNLPRYVAPPDGAAVTPVLQFDASKADLDTATRCVQPIAETMHLPAVTDRGSYYVVAFDVIQ
nr:hypothetical protein [Kofleriaceae bacterium]